jgi:ATP-dependent DNA helicase RecG
MTDVLSDKSVIELPSVGERLAAAFARLGVFTWQDLLFLLPLRYEDRTRLVPLALVRPGRGVLVEGVLIHVDKPRGPRRSFVCRLQEAGASIHVRFFHLYPNQVAQLQVGVRLRCFGEVRLGYSGPEMAHPEFIRLDADKLVPVAETLTPVYPAVHQLPQARIRRCVEQVLAHVSNENLHDWIPGDMLQHVNLPSLLEAIRFVHRPPPDAALRELEAGMHPCQRRLAIEELMAHQLSLRQLRQQARCRAAPVLEILGSLPARLMAGLSFALTGAQRRVLDEIKRDVAQAVPMLRLVQGDVGSGKTIVAALAAAFAVDAGLQVAIMAPTELLAEQHYVNLSRWFEPLGVQVNWLAGSQKMAARREHLGAIAQGTAQVVVGTHALFQEDVQFARLGLVVIDEQHRFGVHQRLALRQKGEANGMMPHQLVMTATPIPRTLAMAACADLDVSVIDELPPGRTPVRTVAMPEQRRPDIIERVREACQDGRQAYWVCTLVEESELIESQAAETTANLLREALPALRIGLVHGRLKAAEKEAVMLAFKQGALDILVATTVIEVGVDVPNASLMIIENAERLGLSQLHQLRGRVGRGTEASTCVLLYQHPLGEMARERLAVMRETTDGFEIARRDLELRGPGEVLGTRQTGEIQLKVADLARDHALLPEIQAMADALLMRDAAACRALVARWVGRGTEYGEV